MWAKKGPSNHEIHHSAADSVFAFCCICNKNANQKKSIGRYKLRLYQVLSDVIDEIV